MTKKRRKRNPNLIKSRRSYTFAEIAKVLKVHIRTVRTWSKQGLQLMDNSRPYLVYGEELKRFLKEKNNKYRVKLQPDEFYCTTCRAARKSKPTKITRKVTGKRLGQHHMQIQTKGVCNICGRSLYRFSSDRKISKIDEVKSLQQELLFGSGDCFENVHLSRRNK